VRNIYLHIITFILFIPLIANGQSLSANVQEKLDSLKKAVVPLAQDTATVEALREITQLYFTGLYQLDSARKYATWLYDLGTKMESERGSALGLYYLGRVADGKGDYATAIGHMEEFLESEIVKGDTAMLANGYYSLANIYLHQGNLEEALKYQLQVLQIDEASGDPRNIGLSLNNLGIIMKELNRDDEAIRYLERALSLFRDLDDKGNIAMALSNLGGLYSQKGDQQKALDTFRRSLVIYEELKHDRGIALAYQHIGSIERILGQTQNALRHNHQALSILQRIGLKKEISETYFETAMVHFEMKNPDSARFCMTRSLALAQEVGDKKAIRRALKGLSDLEADNGNFKTAYEYFRSYHTVSDSILNESIADRMSQLETRYEVEKREAEISNLRTQQKLNRRLSQTLRWALIASGFLGILAVGFLSYRVWIHKKLLRVEQAQNRKVEKAYKELKNAQNQLIHSEKMASLGELTAGIAHEIQNPLNFVNNFSEVNTELAGELLDAVAKGDLNEVQALAKSIRENEDKISSHGKRADGIVKSMLQHSRAGSGRKELTDINALCDEYLRLAYHGFRAKDKSFNAAFKTDLDPSLPKAEVVPQDIGRVILNLINNAFHEVNEKSKANGTGYEPQVIVSTSREEDRIQIKVKDNGNGIPDLIKEKIFQPFFTTKPTGSGTGLGLSLSYDIVKAHGGDIKVETKKARPDEPAGPGKGLPAGQAGTEFIIRLPV
jgi:two-component system, NtrC family, sensor kinase